MRLTWRHYQPNIRGRARIGSLCIIPRSRRFSTSIWFIHSCTKGTYTHFFHSEDNHNVFFFPCFSFFPLFFSVVCCVRFSADGRYLATGCNRTAQIYDVKTGHKSWYAGLTSDITLTLTPFYLSVFWLMIQWESLETFTFEACVSVRMGNFLLPVPRTSKFGYINIFPHSPRVTEFKRSIRFGTLHAKKFAISSTDINKRFTRSISLPTAASLSLDQVIKRHGFGT